MRTTRISLALVTLAVAATAAGAQAFLSPLFPVKSLTQYREVPQGTPTWVAVRITVQPPFHIQANPASANGLPTKLELTPGAGLKVAQTVYPPGQKEVFAGLSPLSVYTGEVEIRAELTVDAAAKTGAFEIPAKLSYQACDDKGRCKAPRTIELKIPLKVVPHGQQPVPGTLKGAATGSTLPPAATVASGPETPPSQIDVQGLFSSHGMAFGLALIFLAGLAINLTPCVFPVIPLTIGFFGMQAGNSRRKSFTLAAFYVLGMAIVYSALGVAAAVLGKVFGFASQSPWVYVAIALILGALSLSMFGLYELKPPAAVTGMRGRSGYLGAMLMGGVVGIAAAPCSGPVVLGLVSYTAQTGKPLLGFGLFLTLSLGLGLPYLLLGGFTGMAKALPKQGDWMEMTRRVFGVVMMYASVYFLGKALPSGTAALLQAGYLLGIGVYLIAGDPRLAQVRRIRVFKSVLGVAVAAFGLVSLLRLGADMGKEAVSWPAVTSPGLQQAKQFGRPTVIDFGAEWCAACDELEKKTFSNPRVEADLSRFAHFKADLTRDPREGDFLYELRRQFAVQGLPVVVFLDGNGHEIPSLRLTSFEPPDRFLERLRRVSATAEAGGTVRHVDAS